LFGLTAVLKPEIMLAAGLITFTAVLVRWRHGEKLEPPLLAMWVGGAILPTLGFAVYFANYFPWTEALRVSCSAWSSVIASSQIIGPQEAAFIGTDQPWQHLIEHVGATLWACTLIAAIVGVAWLTERCPQKWLRLLFGGIWAEILAWVGCFEINWRATGRCLLGLTVIYVIICVWDLLRRPLPGKKNRAATVRLLLAVLAMALMARMFLNGRIFQYGFYQAAMAGLLVPAVLIGELPVRAGLGQWGRNLIVVGCLALLLPGVAILTDQSQRGLRLKTLAVGKGLDRFYSFTPELNPTGKIVDAISEQLGKMPRAHTLVVLPEGQMINYLARLPSPVPLVFFYTSKAGHEDEMVAELQRHPPDVIVIISRNLRERGVQRYGEKSGSGLQILHWVTSHYEQAAAIGGDPLDCRQPGGIILKRKVE
jgi:hypothetical protein